MEEDIVVIIRNLLKAEKGNHFKLQFNNGAEIILP